MITRLSIHSLWICILVFMMLGSCSKDGDSQSPSSEKLPQFNNPTSSPVSDITANSARFAVTITGDGGSAIKVRGVIWNTNPKPTVALSTKTIDSSGTGSFIEFLSGLLPNTKYYARAYATNANGTSYGSEFNFTTENIAANLPVFNNPGSTLISGITATSAQFAVNISSDGGFPITARGVCWSTSAGPTSNLTTRTSAGTGTGSFTSSLSGLSANTKYYARAYATNLNGTGYGNEINFTTKGAVFNPNLTYGTISDIDGNIYKTITIGTQVWMAENLKVSKYQDGTAIPFVSNDNEWTQLNNGGFSIYRNSNPEEYNNTTYGKLYNWFAVVDSRKLCPVGWHVPSDTEWKSLEIFLGMSNSDSDSSGLVKRGLAQNVGGKLKSTWYIWSPNKDATNESGFSGLPGGYRYGYNGYFYNIGAICYWWTSSDNNNPSHAWYRGISSNYGDIGRGTNVKMSGMSVRCLRD